MLVTALHNPGTGGVLTFVGRTTDGDVNQVIVQLKHIKQIVHLETMGFI